MSAQALALELHRTAQARQSVESPLSIAAEQLFARKVRRDEQWPQIAFGRVDDAVEALVLLAIVVYERLDAQLVDNGISRAGQVVEIRRMHIVSGSPQGEVVRLGEFVGVNGDRHPLLHRQQHRNDAREDDALTASAIAVEQQSAPFGRGHPVDDPGILGQVAVAYNRSIEPPEDFAEQTLAIVPVAPREVVRRTDDKAFVCNHAVDKRCDSVHTVCRFVV